MRNTVLEILPREFIREELTDEIHRLLGLAHAVPILRYLKNKGKSGAGWKELDRKVVGNSSTTDKTLKQLVQANWVQKKGTDRRGAYVLTERGERALAYHEQGEKELGG